MRYVKSIGLCLTIASVVCAIATTEASAVEDVYKVNGNKLETNETREIVAGASEEFAFRGKGLLEVEEVVKCKKLKLDEGEYPEVIGGVPGTSAKEKIELEECSATVGGTKCSGVEIENTAMNNELVTVVAPSGLKGKLATLFTPASGKVLFKIRFKSCGLLGSPTAEVEGTTAAETSPEGVFEPEGTWAWSEKEEITEVETSKGKKIAVGLVAGGKNQAMQGRVVLLVPIIPTNGTNGNFGKVKVNTTKKKTFTFENIVVVDYENLKINAGLKNGFAIVAGSEKNCKGLVKRKNVCELEIEFSPKVAEKYTSDLVITFEIANIRPGLTFTVQLAGEGE
jgi:hypothetical protein